MVALIVIHAGLQAANELLTDGHGGRVFIARPMAVHSLRESVYVMEGEIVELTVEEGGQVDSLVAAP